MGVIGVGNGVRTEGGERPANCFQSDDSEVKKIGGC